MSAFRAPRTMPILSTISTVAKTSTLMARITPRSTVSTMTFVTRSPASHVPHGRSMSSGSSRLLFASKGLTAPALSPSYLSRLFHSRTAASVTLLHGLKQSGQKKAISSPGIRFKSSSSGSSLTNTNSNGSGRISSRNSFSPSPLSSLDPGNILVYSIVGVNVAIFAVWQYAEGNATRFRDGRLLKFMFENFADTAQNLRQGRVWTLLTSTFSHREWYHILLNMMVLLSFGNPVYRLLGTSRFLAVYVGSGIASSLSSVAYYAYLEPYLKRMQHKRPTGSLHYSLGASGSIMGITTAFACVYPMSQYSLFFVINMPAAALIGLFGAYELYNVLSANTGRFDSAGHLGGGLFGAAYYWTRLRPFLRR